MIYEIFYTLKKILLPFSIRILYYYFTGNPKVVKRRKIDSKKKHKKWSILLSLSLAQKRKNRWV